MPVLYFGWYKSKAFCQAYVLPVCHCVPPSPVELQEACPSLKETRLVLTLNVRPRKALLSCKGVALPEGSGTLSLGAGLGWAGLVLLVGLLCSLGWKVNSWA